MVYKRKSLSKMAAAAVAAAWIHEEEGADTDSFAAVGDVIVAVHEVIPDKAPAFAAEAARKKKAPGALCTAIAAAVAAAAVGWEFEDIKKVSLAASKAFKDNEHKSPAEIAKEVAKKVRGVSSRYPSVEAAAEAAYAAYLSKHPVTSGSEAPSSSPSDGIVKGGAAIAAANAAREAAKASEDDLDRSSGEAAKASEDDLDRSSGEAAKANKKDLDLYFYAATAAARAGTFRGAESRFLFSASVQTATLTSEESSADVHKVLEHVTATIAVASYGDKLRPASLGACGQEILEGKPSSHEIIYGKLQTIVGLDTFLAGFLLFSLTGRKQAERAAYSGEVVQTVLQVYCFAVFLAATLSAGLFMVVTGGTYALTKRELILPTALSTIGFVLLLVTVADAVYLELGEGVYHEKHLAPLYWATVVAAFIIQLVVIGFGVFFAMHGSKYRWHFSCRDWPRARRVDYPRYCYFSRCCCIPPRRPGGLAGNQEAC